MRVRTLGLAGFSALMLAGTVGTVRAQAPARKAWVHVRVEEANRQSKVSVNLPVTVVEAALQAAPEDIMSHGHIHLGKMGKRDLSVSDLRKAWNEMKATGDLAPTGAVGKVILPLTRMLPDMIPNLVLVPTDDLEMQDDHHFDLAGHKLWSEHLIGIMQMKGWFPWAK